MQLLILHMHTLLSEFERKDDCNPAVSTYIYILVLASHTIPRCISVWCEQYVFVCNRSTVFQYLKMMQTCKGDVSLLRNLHISSECRCGHMCSWYVLHRTCLDIGSKNMKCQSATACNFCCTYKFVGSALPRTASKCLFPKQPLGYRVLYISS